MRQTLIIPDWLPDQLANGSHGHWRIRQKKLKAAQVMVWASAKQEKLQPVVGKARLTVTLVFSTERRRDIDNLYSRTKGVIDGLVRGGWIRDDSTDWLDLIVKAEVQKGIRETRLTLEPVNSDSAASAATSDAKDE